MDQNGAVGSSDPKKDRSKAQEGMVPSRLLPVQPQTATALSYGADDHGPNGLLPNGVSPSEQTLPTSNGAPASTSFEDAGPENPPQLDQSWRQHESNKSLGVLMERLAQKCYKDLNDTLTNMSQLQLQPQQQQPNGIVAHATDGTSSGSLQKKRLLMDFAKEQRDRFIKTLVLSDWCKNEEEQSRLIDVKVWQDKQRMAGFNAARGIEQIKANMIPAKVPNPNIEGAMDLLATSKANWLPDLGFTPPKRLTAKQLLKTLRDMNVILATRLNLLEDIPPGFHDFAIADGRATFVVKDEFEVDLSVADEDPATPFYFIDIRLLFTPASNVLDDRLRGFMEAKVNHELGTKGLKGCYDFLHNFVVTHKINVLRSQAADMVRAKWFDCIRTENVRRNFIVQYWVGMPGPKSWIEFGISSGKEQAARLGPPVVPQISVRWFRRGVEMKDDGLKFDWRNLSLERCISTVISRHTKWILKETESRARGLAGSSSHTAVEITNLDSASEHPTLLLNQAALREALRVRIEPVTGQYTITPPTPSTSSAERRLNNDPSADPAKLLAWLVSATAQARITTQVELLGWIATPSLVKQDNLGRIFGETVRHLSVFTPSKAWGEQWALAATFSLDRPKWWAVSLDEKRGAEGGAPGKVIVSARRVSQHSGNKGESKALRTSLIRIERSAVAEVALSALSKQLKDMGVPYESDESVKGNAEEQNADNSASVSVTMYIDFSALLKPPMEKDWKAWAANLVRWTHYGILDDPDSNGNETVNVQHALRLTLEPGRMKTLRKQLSRFKDPDIAMSSSGGLALRIRTPFGQPFAEHVRERLQSVERLDHFVAILQERHFKCTHVGSTRLAFTYHQNPKLSAQLSFLTNKVVLDLRPEDKNPHCRIKAFLQRMLSTPDPNAFSTFTYMLRFTLPALQALTQLERVRSGSLLVLARASTWFSLVYRSPLPHCQLQLRARKRAEGAITLVKWHVQVQSPDEPTEQTVKSETPPLPEDLLKALDNVWKSKGEHWEGLGKGLIADAVGIGDALRRVDEVVRQFESVEEAAVKKEEARPAAIEPSNDKSQPQLEAAPLANSTIASVKDDPDVIMID